MHQNGSTRVHCVHRKLTVLILKLGHLYKFRNLRYHSIQKIHFLEYRTTIVVLFNNMERFLDHFYNNIEIYFVLEYSTYPHGENINLNKFSFGRAMGRATGAVLEYSAVLE